jgi:hypothetical protein
VRILSAGLTRRRDRPRPGQSSSRGPGRWQLLWDGPSQPWPSSTASKSTWPSSTRRRDERIPTPARCPRAEPAAALDDEVSVRRDQEIDSVSRAQLGRGMVRLRWRAHGLNDFSHCSLQRLNTLHELRDHVSCRGCRPKGLPIGISKPPDLLYQRSVNRRHHGSRLTFLAGRKRAKRPQPTRARDAARACRDRALAGEPPGWPHGFPASQVEPSKVLPGMAAV